MNDIKITCEAGHEHRTYTDAATCGEAIALRMKEQTELLETLDSFKQCLPMLFEAGPDYSRAVATNWESARHCAAKGDMNSARYFWNLVLKQTEELA